MRGIDWTRARRTLPRSSRKLAKLVWRRKQFYGLVKRCLKGERVVFMLFESLRPIPVRQSAGIARRRKLQTRYAVDTPPLDDLKATGGLGLCVSVSFAVLCCGRMLSVSFHFTATTRPPQRLGGKRGTGSESPLHGAVPRRFSAVVKAAGKRQRAVSEPLYKDTCARLSFSPCMQPGVCSLSRSLPRVPYASSPISRGRRCRKRGECYGCRKVRVMATSLAESGTLISKPRDPQKV